MKLYDKLNDAYWFCYRVTRDYISWPVWYRVFGYKHHIVKTGLPPHPWYDTDTRMLYAVMSLVEWFVENDMMMISKDKFEAECDRIKKEEDKEYQEKSLEEWAEQFENQNKIIGICLWWENYPKRLEEIDKARSDWHGYIESFQKDDDFLSFFRMKMKNIITDDQKAEEERLNDIIRGLKNKLKEEETQMLIRAVELRGSMWS